ncbi:hypothetical protein [Cronobacter sakazakii]|uniref:hypothetical protein n=1 Tax=Cronobacter sakazakii TaxID=28141 RepID=UPI000BE8BE95|nr:hypothetical protein [Cronobacter sakazakii]ELY2773029.1 hypothetical protein [Cronobacter sakazakii]PQV82391.1 hypothetical protein CDT99_21995 [Cronobacter sakazakii]HDK7323815.1 hypothetical protein [Cronobacter sakazakii]
MKVINLSLPESGLILIDCKSGKVVGKIDEVKTRSGKPKIPERVLFTRFDKTRWKSAALRKDEVVCSLKTFKEISSSAARSDAKGNWF